MVHCNMGAPPSETTTLITGSGPADRHEAHSTTAHSTKALPADSNAHVHVHSKSKSNSRSRSHVRSAWLAATGCLAVVAGVSYVSLSGRAPWAADNAMTLSGTESPRPQATSRVASAADPTDAGATDETRQLLKALQVK
jgi:hypothetical protein